MIVLKDSLYKKMLAIRDHYINHAINVDRDWGMVKDTLINHLYRFYFNQYHPHFFSLEDPQVIEQTRLNIDGRYMVALADIAHALLTTCDSPAFTQSDDQFLTEFETHLSAGKIAVQYVPQFSSFSSFN